jgi:hypothetical protein
VPRASVWTPRSSACRAQRDIGLGTTIKYLCDAQLAASRATAWAPRQVPATQNKRRRGQRPGPIPGIINIPIHHKRPGFACFVPASVFM